MKNSVCLMALVALLAFVPLANAALTINYQIGAGPVANCGVGSDTGPVTCSFTGGGVDASIVSSKSNSPGTPGIANQFGSALNVTSTASTTVHIWFTAQDFTMPIFGSPWAASLSTTATSDNTNSTAGLVSCIDVTNGTAPALGCTAGTITNADQTLMGAGSDSQTLMSTAGPLSTPYSLEQEITLTLTPGSDLNVITSQSLAVPEPAAILFLGTAILGVMTILRRKAVTRS